MIKEVTDPHHFPSRAVIPAREWAKRRQGRMWVGLLSAEKKNSWFRVPKHSRLLKATLLAPLW